MIQLDLFEKDQIALFLEEMRKIKESSDKARRGLFKRYDELAKEILELKKQRSGV